MDSKGGNPFLMDDFSSDAAADASASNPFLQGFGAETAEAPSSGLAENPFFSFGADQSSQPSADSTNPFAAFGAEAAVPEPESEVFVNPEAATIPEPTTTPVTPSVFKNEEPAAVSSIEPKTVETSQPVAAAPPPRPAPPPSRPPPPRPAPPPAPPRNTKDLILSVTGAMDETSSQMLDKLQATRTPSPTLMHSPSPTPEHSFVDFVDVDSSVPDFVPDERKLSITADTAKTQDMLGLHDDQMSHSDVGKEANLSTVTEPTHSNNAPVMASTISENPFSDVGSKEEEVSGQISGHKRPSISSETRSSVPPPVPEHPKYVKEPSIDQSLGSENVPMEEVASVAKAADNPFADVSASHDQYRDEFVSENQGHAEYDEVAQNYTSSKGPQEISSFPEPSKTQHSGDAFDAFSSKFDQVSEHEVPPSDPFLDPFSGGQTAMDTSSDVWGDSSNASTELVTGFGDADGFDSFLSMTAPPPELNRKRDSDPDFNVYIKPRDAEYMAGDAPALQPPPRGLQNAAYTDSSSRFNPFDKSAGFAQEAIVAQEAYPGELTRSDSQETPPTPLFDEDVSQPLEDFPRITYAGEGWEMQLRMPLKKKITGQRFWKKIFVVLVYQGDSPVLQLFNNKGEKDPFQELPLLACYSVSEIAAQQFDQYGKIFTVKLQYIFYKERPGVRPGQVTKAERITNKLSQFAAYAIQGDYQGVKEFGSDLKKLGLPVEHAPQISQLFKLGSQDYEDCKVFSHAIEEALFRLSAHRDRALHYKMEEVQINVVDEVYIEQNALGHVEKQIARVRLFFLGFLSGMHDVELGINDMWRQGKEVVGRHDIIPMATEEWIRLECVEFHSCVQQDEYERTRVIKFKPPDACYIELLRFRVRPPKNRELPLQLKAVYCVTGNRVELRCDILVPGFASRKLGRVPCEDVSVRFPIPECWIYLFRVEKHFRYGSKKSAHRRTGKIKGIERFLGTVENLDPQLLEVTSGQAKYEHQHHSIVWRMPRLPKEGQGAYTNHQLVCRMNLTSFDQIPEKLPEYCYVEFTMPCTQVSHTTARSVSFQDYEGDEPPEKYVKHLSRHEYRVGIEHTQAEGPGAYITATSVAKTKIPESGGESHDESIASDHHPASDSDSTD